MLCIKLVICFIISDFATPLFNHFSSNFTSDIIEFRINIIKASSITVILMRLFLHYRRGFYESVKILKHDVYVGL